MIQAIHRFHRDRRNQLVFPSDILVGFRGFLASTVKVSAGAWPGNTDVCKLGRHSATGKGLSFAHLPGTFCRFLAYQCLSKSLF
jgi:hypothetical protein